jgi:hypothetical protein
MNDSPPSAFESRRVRTHPLTVHAVPTGAFKASTTFSQGMPDLLCMAMDEE